MKSLLAASIATVVLMTGCTTMTEPDRVPMRSLTKAETGIVDASSEFGYNLFREVNNADLNQSTFISPLSVSMALGMTMNGASGATLDSMRQTLAFAGLTETEINSAYRTLITLLTQVDPGVKFQIANSIWYRDGFEVEQAFIDTNAYYFDAAVRALDFSAPNASSTINGWVKEKTGSKIEKIVPDKISADVVMYLINAIYFKGAWSQKFDSKETQEQPFTLANGTTKQVRTMHAYGEYRYLENNQVQMIDLPYGDSLFTMTVVLPRSNDINGFITGLTEADMKTWSNAAKRNEGNIYLPKFKLEYEKSLNDMLKAMGMSVAFSDMADFTRIRTTGGLYISEVKHKTFVEVNEEGTEAAAATSVEIRETSAPASPFMMRVDRPFVFLIRERTSGAILFMGKIMEPKS